jgi:hypothetical protein
VREREMQNMSRIVIFIFKKGMTGALAPFSSLVFHNVIFQILKLCCLESCPDVYFYIQQFTSQETDVSFI